MPVITSPSLRKVVYTDIDLNFKPNPITGDVSIKRDEHAVKQAIKTLLLTMFFEKPFHPEIGSSLNNLLFEHAGPALKAIIEREIINTITNWEPRVEIINVTANIQEDQHSVEVDVTFRFIETSVVFNATFILYRSR